MLSVYGTERIQVGTEPVADSLLHNWGDDKQDLFSQEQLLRKRHTKDVIIQWRAHIPKYWLMELFKKEQKKTKNVL